MCTCDRMTGQLNITGSPMCRSDTTLSARRGEIMLICRFVFVEIINCLHLYRSIYSLLIFKNSVPGPSVGYSAFHLFRNHQMGRQVFYY